MSDSNTSSLVAIRVALITGIFAVLTGAVPNIIDFFGKSKTEKEIAKSVESYFQENAEKFVGVAGNDGQNGKDGVPGPGLPIGTIVAWSPEKANSQFPPRGWKIADGTNGTPNLTGRFLYGVQRADADKISELDIGYSQGHAGAEHSRYKVPYFSVVYIVRVQ